MSAILPALAGGLCMFVGLVIGYGCGRRDSRS